MLKENCPLTERARGAGSGDALRAVAEALESMFTPGQLRRCIRVHLFELSGHLPEVATPAELAHCVADLTLRHDLERELLVALAATRRSPAAIRELAARLGVEPPAIVLRSAPPPLGRRGIVGVASLLALTGVSLAAWSWGPDPSASPELDTIEVPADRGAPLPDRYHVEVELERDTWKPGEPLAMRVRSDHEGYLWIFEPKGGAPNPLFPCGADFPGCLRESPPTRIPRGTWRQMPSDADHNQICAGWEPGSERLVVMVTQTDDPLVALTHLHEVVPEVSVKAQSVPTGAWGARTVGYRVEDHSLPPGP